MAAQHLSQDLVRPSSRLQELTETMKKMLSKYMRNARNTLKHIFHWWCFGAKELILQWATQGSKQFFVITKMWVQIEKCSGLQLMPHASYQKKLPFRGYESVTPWNQGNYIKF